MNDIECERCGKKIEAPEGACPICFGDILGDINDIEDPDERYDKFTVWINELTYYDYECGMHNAVCPNTLGEHDTPEYVRTITLIKIIKRLIELKHEFWKKKQDKKDYDKFTLLGKYYGIEKALTVIDGFANFDKEIHKLIDDSRK